MTNGQYWNIAQREGNGWKPEVSLPLGLHFEKTGENAQRLWDTLSKEAVKQAPAKPSDNFRAAASNRRQYGRRR